MGTANIKNYCLSDGEEFYPTPKELARKMLEQIDFSTVFSILEPSAGKGDLAAEILRQMNISKSCHCTSDEWRIDVVEVDPSLQSILRQRFTKEGKRLYASKLFEEMDAIEKDRISYFKKDGGRDHYFELKEQISWMKNEENVRLVHDDFLTYSPMEPYDAIIMNPPFKNAEFHLFHAIELLQHYGGQIVCIMNAETVRNPYTKSRQQLSHLLDQYHAGEVDIESAIKRANASGTYRNIELKYFKISLYKKGTVHIVFHDKTLIDRFNIFASQQKGWLPPSYGKKSYKDMTPEEAAVIDSFQGEEAYRAVMQNPSKYFMTDTTLLRLTAS